MKKSKAGFCMIAAILLAGSSTFGQLTRAAGAQSGVAAAERQRLDAEREHLHAMTQAGGGGGEVFLKSAGTGDRTLIVPKEPVAPENLAAAEEDLNVMRRILEKAANSDDGKAAMGIYIPQNLFGGRSAPRNLYIEGYGALFFLNVSYPLVAPNAKKAESEPKEERSSEWDEARRELYQTPQGLGFKLPGALSFADRRGEPYSAEKVDSLKENLISALKNAAHIRGLKKDEVIAVVVTGRAEGESRKVVTHSDGSHSGGGAGDADYYFRSWVNRKGDGERGARMLLRASRGDIEAFQKGKLDQQAFAKKVAVLLY